MNSQIALYLLPVFLLLAVILWYVIKGVLNKNGYKTDPLRQHTRDIANLHDLVTWEKNPGKKSRYTMLLAFFYLSLLAALGSFLFYFFSILG